MATTRPLSRIPAARLRPQTLAATLQEAAPTSSPCTALPLGDFPPNPPPPPKIRGGKKGRRKGGAGVAGGEGACTASLPPGVKARPPEGRPPPLPEAGGRRIHGSADDARKSKDRATQEPELYKPLTTAPSLSRTPLLPLHRAVRRLAETPRSGAAAQGRCRCGSHGPRRPASPAPGHSTLLVTTSSPPCLEREVSTEAFTLLWNQPSSRGWTEPCELAV
jgi:hypothetical protein